MYIYIYIYIYLYIYIYIHIHEGLGEHARLGEHRGGQHLMHISKQKIG